MFEAFLKQLIVDGNGAYTVCRIAAETEEGLRLKRETYLADDWQDSSKEEYEAQFANRTAPVESAEDKALGGEEAPEAPAETPEAPEQPEGTPVETSPAPEA